MIQTTVAAADVLASQGIKLFCRIQSWLGETQLADDVPISAGTEELDATLRVPERITLTVPRVDDQGMSWVPTAYNSPLSWFGQHLTVQLGIEVGNDQIEWLNRGEFLLNSVETQGDSLNVEALGQLALADEARLVSEYQPASTAQFGDIIRDLLLPGIGVNDDAAPTDRIPAATAMSWSDNRLDCVLAALDAWPAQGNVDENGSFVITSVPGTPTAAQAVLNLTDGYGGTVVTPQTSGGRDGLFNTVIATGQTPDSDPTNAGQPIVATAYVADPTNPLRYGGAFSPYLVPFSYASPLLTTRTQALKAANTVLARKLATATKTIVVQCIPDPRVQLGDIVTVTSERLGIDSEVGTIQGVSLPYLPGDGSLMSLTVVLVV